MHRKNTVLAILFLALALPTAQAHIGPVLAMRAIQGGPAQGLTPAPKQEPPPPPFPVKLIGVQSQVIQTEGQPKQVITTFTCAGSGSDCPNLTNLSSRP